jgi:hypothetical protein
MFSFFVSFERVPCQIFHPEYSSTCERVALRFALFELQNADE